MELSRKILEIKPSSTLAITAKANELKANGKDVVGFAAGEPDMDTPEHIKEAARLALNSGFTKYTPASGIPELKAAICNKLKNDNGLIYSPSQIIVSNGAKHSLANVFMTILNDGDEVIVPAPFWLSYTALITIAGGTPVIINTKKENNFVPTRDELESVVSNKTKAIIFSSPNNPTGMIYSKEALEMIGEFAIAHDLIIISDEIYEKLIYAGNKKHISIASLSKEIFDRTVVINGVSKSYSMTGWRIGYAACPQEIATPINSLQSHMTSNPNSIAQKAALAAISGPSDCVEKMRLTFEGRRDYIYERITKIPLLSAFKPEGAFYLFVDISKVKGMKFKDTEISSAADFAKLILENYLVAVIPCADFSAPDYIRLSYAISMENIKKGMDRIEEFVNSLSR